MNIEETNQQLLYSNHGLLWDKELADQEDTDYLAGTMPVNIASIPLTERWLYMPVGEVQRALEDTSACASFSPSNGWKMMLKYMWDKDLLTSDNRKFFAQYFKNGVPDVSEAFIAIKSGTTKQGNSLKAPLQTIHDSGMIPGHMLPLEPWMTWEDYHNPKRITPAMEALGEECARRLVFNYERVYEPDYDKWVETHLITVGGFAWPFPNKDGVVERVTYPHNHAFLYFDKVVSTFAYLTKKFLRKMFDSYPDTFDGDFIKTLAPDYDLTDYGYVLLFSSQGNAEADKIVSVVYDLLKKFGMPDVFAKWLAIFTKKVQGFLKGVWND